MATSFTKRTGIEVDVEVQTGVERLSPETEITAYRAVQELLARIASLDDDGRVHVAIARTPADVQVVIVHDTGGHGLLDGGPSLDLVGLGERIRLAGGRLDARSAAARTTVRLELPP